MVPQVAAYPTVELTRGADFYDTITVTDPDTNEVVDLTGYTFKWQFRAGRTAAFDLIADLGVTATTELTITPLDGEIYGRIPGAITVDFPDVVWHDFRADAPSPSLRSFWWRGKLTLTDGVTEL
jgi:hypothetical protein